MPQLNLFEKVELTDEGVEPKTEVRLHNKAASINLKRKQREAYAKLKEMIAELEGKDVYVGQYCDFWWYARLRLNRLQIEWGYMAQTDIGGVPGVITFRGNKGAEIRFFTQLLWNVRKQFYTSEKPYYLIDFWNGFGENPIDKYHKAGYQSLHLETVS